ncbi:hypothetical protein ACHHYP_07091 [Achlya hypogyna]|uniref:Secreted protein n=1 Tax=Achlya hypogyna TaxID=1202772 RepID=A0A1V9ZMU2_ACHHY|nr:hypothetical protein ACHHYP_07091 [Achlya hypogyna]
MAALLLQVVLAVAALGTGSPALAAGVDLHVSIGATAPDVCHSITTCSMNATSVCHRAREPCPSCLLPLPHGYACVLPQDRICPRDPPHIDCRGSRRLVESNTTREVLLRPTDPPSNPPLALSANDQAPPLSVLHIAYIVGVSLCTMSIFGFLFLYRPARPSPKEDVPILNGATSSRKMDTVLDAFGTNAILQLKTLHPIDASSPLEPRASYFDSVRTSDLLTCARQIPLLEDEAKPKTRAVSGGTLIISEEQELPKDLEPVDPLLRLTDAKKTRTQPLDNLMSPYSIGSSESSDSAISDSGEDVYMSRSFSWNKFEHKA